MQYIEFDLSKNEAEIKSVDGEIAKGNVGSVELHIINAPADWDGKTVWATFIKGEVELPCITSKKNDEYVTPVPDYVFIDDRNFGIYVWCVGGQNYIETRRVLRIPVAETGTFKGETVDPETLSSVDQLLGAMQTLKTAVEAAEENRYRMYYDAEGVTKGELNSDEFKSRMALYQSAETNRENNYTKAEGDRQTAFENAESERQTTLTKIKEKLDSIIAYEDVVQRAECDDLGQKIRDTYARKDEIQNNLNIVHDINVVEGDDEFDAVPSVRGLKIALVYNATDVVGYVDRSLENIIKKYGLGGGNV